MTFLELYGIELDRELGTADRSQLFTLVRRKAAVNAGQLEWVKRTECLQRQVSFVLEDDRQEYDMEAATDFAWIAKNGVSIKIVTSTSTRYIEGDDLDMTSVARLNVEEPGWRAQTASTPKNWYQRRTGGTVQLGLHNKPNIIGSDVWTALVQIVMVPTDMSLDADEPFTCSGNPLRSMRPYHRAIAHYAAYDLEKFRKDQARGGAQLQLFELEVAKFTGVEKPRGGTQVRFSRVYRRPMGNPRMDPRT